MIRHCVFARFPDSLAADAVDELLADLHAVCAPLDGVIDVRIGANTSPEVDLADGYRHGFVIDFATAADRDGYLVDAGHRAFGARLGAAADGVFVFDFDLG